MFPDGLNRYTYFLNSRQNKQNSLFIIARQVTLWSTMNGIADCGLILTKQRDEANAERGRSTYLRGCRLRRAEMKSHANYKLQKCIFVWLPLDNNTEHHSPYDTSEFRRDYGLWISNDDCMRKNATHTINLVFYFTLVCIWLIKYSYFSNPFDYFTNS